MLLTPFPKVAEGSSSFEDYCLRVFNHLDPQSMFLSIKGYCNNHQEISDFQIVFHVNYFNAVRKTLFALKEYEPSPQDCKGQSFTYQDLRQARAYLLVSLQESLKREKDPNFIHPNYTCGGVYSSVKGKDDKNIKGVILHKRTSSLHINGIKTKKKILKKGSYGKDSRRPETLAKQWLKQGTPLENWRQFKLTPGRFKKLAVQKEVIVG